MISSAPAPPRIPTVPPGNLSSWARSLSTKVRDSSTADDPTDDVLSSVESTVSDGDDVVGGSCAEED